MTSLLAIADNCPNRNSETQREREYGADDVEAEGIRPRGAPNRAGPTASLAGADSFPHVVGDQGAKTQGKNQ
jgi:hypothetical protein